MKTPHTHFFILVVTVWAGSQVTEVSVDREGNESSQSYAQTVSYTGSSHGELPVSVLHLSEVRMDKQ